VSRLEPLLLAAVAFAAAVAAAAISTCWPKINISIVKQKKTKKENKRKNIPAARDVSRLEPMLLARWQWHPVADTVVAVAAIAINAAAGAVAVVVAAAIVVVVVVDVVDGRGCGWAGSDNRKGKQP
jgi:hypothetical protein